MGHAGKRKEMVKDRRVQRMYVEGRCVKGMYAIVRKSSVYVCDRIVRENVCVCMCVCACVCVCVVWPPKCMRYVLCACVCVRVYVYELPKQKRTDVPLENIFHTCAHLQKRTCKFPARQTKSMAASLAAFTAYAKPEASCSNSTMFCPFKQAPNCYISKLRHLLRKVEESPVSLEES